MYYIWEWRVACWRLYLITCDYCREQENTIWFGVSSKYIERERESKGGGGWVVGGGEGSGIYTTPHHTHTPTQHTHTLHNDNNI